MSKKTIEVELQRGQHIRIRTPDGTITYFAGKHYKSLTASVEDVSFVGFYSDKTTKKTRTWADGTRMTKVEVVEE